MSYTKTNWQNGATPAINADNLNKIEDELEALDAGKVGFINTSDVITTFNQQIGVAESSTECTYTATRDCMFICALQYTPSASVLTNIGTISLDSVGLLTVFSTGGGIPEFRMIPLKAGQSVKVSTTVSRIYVHGTVYGLT